MIVDPYSCEVIGQRLMRPQKKLIRDGYPFTSPNSFKLDDSPDEVSVPNQIQLKGPNLFCLIKNGPN